MKNINIESVKKTIIPEENIINIYTKKKKNFLIIIA